jgi:hypothetical protein
VWNEKFEFVPEDRVPSFSEDGKLGPLVDRVAVVVKDFVVGQDKKSESWELQQKETIKKPTSAQIDEFTAKITANVDTMTFEDAFFGCVGGSGHKGSGTKTLASSTSGFFGIPHAKMKGKKGKTPGGARGGNGDGEDGRPKNKKKGSKSKAIEGLNTASANALERVRIVSVMKPAITAAVLTSQCALKDIMYTHNRFVSTPWYQTRRMDHVVR